MVYYYGDQLALNMAPLPGVSFQLALNVDGWVLYSMLSITE